MFRGEAMNRRDLLKSLPPILAAHRMPMAFGAADDRVASMARLRPAICAYAYRDALKEKKLTYQDLVRMSVEQGAEGIDCTVYWFPPNPGDDFLLPLRRLAYHMAVDIYSLAISTDLCRAPGPEREAEVEKVKRWVDVAQKLGSSHIRVFGGNVPKGSNEEQSGGWAAETLRRCAEYSGSRGISLGIENHGGITGRAERIIQIVKQADSPWVGINVDTGNFRADGYSQIEMCIPYAVNVQLKTDISVEGGKREPQDWNRILGMFAKAGYKGFLSIEYEAKEDPMTAVPRLMKELRTLTRKYSA
jgi:sugar phosphate isomerase/epimerase